MKILSIYWFNDFKWTSLTKVHVIWQGWGGGRGPGDIEIETLNWAAPLLKAHLFNTLSFCWNEVYKYQPSPNIIKAAPVSVSKFTVPLIFFSHPIKLLNELCLKQSKFLKSTFFQMFIAKFHIYAYIPCCKL